MLLVLVSAAAVDARTLTLTAEDCDRMAVISEKVPRLSWAVSQASPGVYDTNRDLQMFQGMSTLLRFPLDRIPKGQRITKAELTLRAGYVDGGPRLHLRRLVAEWGPGVCHQYRATQPQKLEWAQPGGRAAARDRAERDSGAFNFQAVGEQTVDVTEDIDLWYTGATANRGWILRLESGYAVYLPSPYSAHNASAKMWKLTITFEPQ